MEKKNGWGFGLDLIGGERQRDHGDSWKGVARRRRPGEALVGGAVVVHFVLIHAVGSRAPDPFGEGGLVAHDLCGALIAATPRNTITSIRLRLGQLRRTQERADALKEGKRELFPLPVIPGQSDGLVILRRILRADRMQRMSPGKTTVLHRQ